MISKYTPQFPGVGVYALVFKGAYLFFVTEVLEQGTEKITLQLCSRLPILPPRPKSISSIELPKNETTTNTSMARARLAAAAQTRYIENPPLSSATGTPSPQNISALLDKSCNKKQENL